MQEIIDSAVLELIRIIESKQDSRKVAWQFVLEELDAVKMEMISFKTGLIVFI